ncbi:catalytic activity protein [[Candida] boidinii]|nr:catalytic activity protein [[Candida] boidinii]
MAKRGQKKNNKYEEHKDPLPIEIVNIPNLLPTNPISWFTCLYSYLIQLNNLPNPNLTKLNKIPIELKRIKKNDNNNNDNNNKEDAYFIFKVTKYEDMIKLWNKGFFGKGIFSRSEPNWKIRTMNRLGLSGGTGDSTNNINNNNVDDQIIVTNEELTKIRRELRSQYKDERSKLDELENQYKKSGLINKLKDIEIMRNDLNLKKKQNDYNTYKLAIDKIKENKLNLNSLNNKLRIEDLNIIIQDNDIENENEMQTVKNLEYLQLMPYEAIFLSIFLNSTKIIENDSIENSNFKILIEFLKLNESNCLISPDNKNLLKLIVYLHYKTLGWCVRSGFKFSADFIIYERGPPFTHAEFALVIKSNDPYKDSKRDDHQLSELNNNNAERDDDNDNEDQQESWINYSSVSRVISGVKKTFLLVYVDIPNKDRFNEVLTKLLNSINNDKNDDNNDDEEKLKILIELINLYKINEIVYRRWLSNRTRD